MTEDIAPFTVRGSRWKAAKQVAVSLCLFVLCMPLLKSDVARPLVIGGTILVLIPVLLAVVGLIRPATLTVRGDGFYLRGLRSWFVPWEEVARFRLITFRRSSYVAIDYRDAGSNVGALVSTKRPRSIPRTLQHDAESILDLLNQGLAYSRSIDAATSEAEQSIEIPEPTTVWPWLSLALAVILGLVFAAELRWPVAPPDVSGQPGVQTLAAFGGLSRSLVVDYGQWFRLTTAPFLHGSVAHIALNIIALILAGRLLEGLVGRLWFTAIYITGALTGAAGSMLLNSPTTVSVGASGAIVALFAAIYVCSFHFGHSAGRNKLQARATGVLIPTLLNIGTTGNNLKIDFGAHLGGAVGGALVGFLILNVWSAQGDKPGLRKFALATTMIGAMAVTVSLWPAFVDYRAFASVATSNSGLPLAR